jgi:hypothetical protein
VPADVTGKTMAVMSKISSDARIAQQYFPGVTIFPLKTPAEVVAAVCSGAAQTGLVSLNAFTDARMPDCQVGPLRYLLNKPGRSGRSPRRTENHRFGSLFDQIRQGGHLSGSADPVADVLKEVHSQFPGCAEQRFHRVPRPGTGQ